MKNFRVQVVLRVVLLTATLTSLAFLLVYTHLVVSAAVAVGLVLVQVIWLIAYIEQTNRTLDRFFSAIRYDDFMTNSYPQGGGRTFEKLTRSLAEITRQFRKVRAEKETSYRYLEQVVHHIDTAMISFQENGDVSFLNPAARRLFQVAGLNRIASLAASYPLLTRALSEMKSGEKRVMSINRSGENLELAISMTTFKLGSKGFRLATFLDIRNELERKEVDAWQKLIRVLTHEIMNSVTPISTLAETVQGMMKPTAGAAEHAGLSPEKTGDVSQAIEIIRRRSQGLLQFVGSYRDLTRIPPPQFESVAIDAFFQDMSRLFGKQFEREAIDFQTACDPPDLTVMADPQLLEQVLINLLMNAMQALENQADKKIRLEAYSVSWGGVEIRVWDNGPGISMDQLEQIFIPFYSTKDEGMGVGLSISRQIMQAQGGSIRVHSEPGEGTAFLLTW